MKTILMFFFVMFCYAYIWAAPPHAQPHRHDRENDGLRTANGILNLVGKGLRILSIPTQPVIVSPIPETVAPISVDYGNLNYVTPTVAPWNTTMSLSTVVISPSPIVVPTRHPIVIPHYSPKPITIHPIKSPIRRPGNQRPQPPRKH